jgi:hypothetical protein
MRSYNIMNEDLEKDIATLKDLVLLRQRLEAKVAATLPEVRAQVVELQAKLDAATVDDRAELTAAKQYEDQIRERVSKAIGEAWQSRWESLSHGVSAPALELPSWLQARRLRAVEVTDESLIPAEHKSVDLKSILNAGVDVPGSRVIVKASVSVITKELKNECK